LEGEFLMEAIKCIPRRLRHVLFKSDMSFVELVLSVVYLLWGYVLLSRQGQIEDSPSYKPMVDSIGLWFWGTILIMVGLTKLTGVLLEIRALRAAGALMGLMLWLAIATTFLLTAAVPTGVVVYLVFASICLLTLLRHARMIGLKRNRADAAG
jgi:hypothetical protein